jgi:cold-inducible RNA-binding protein
MKLFVGKLDFSTTQAALTNHFQQFAPSSVKIIEDRETGGSRGFGFVMIDDTAQAAEAIKVLNNSTLDGRSIVVNEARERQEGGRSFNTADRPQGGGFRGRNSAPRSSTW